LHIARQVIDMPAEPLPSFSAKPATAFDNECGELLAMVSHVLVSLALASSLPRPARGRIDFASIAWGCQANRYINPAPTVIDVVILDIQNRSLDEFFSTCPSPRSVPARDALLKERILARPAPDQTANSLLQTSMALHYSAAALANHGLVASFV